MKCSECEYWERHEEEKIRGKVIVPNLFGGCYSEKLQYKGELCSPKTTDMLLYSDYEGYYASLETGQDFGCIHFKKQIEE